MSDSAPLAKLAMRALADCPPDVVPPSPRDGRDAVAAIARELDSIRARRTRRIALFASVSIAAAVALAVGLSSTRTASEVVTIEDVSGTVLAVRGEHGVTLARGATVSKGDRIVASAAGSTTLRLRRDSELFAANGADVLVVEHGRTELFELRAGSVHLHVSKREPGERFVVRTSDAEVEVRGTQFRVDVAEPCSGTSTRVVVTEGTVVVRHAGTESRVVANETWPAGCGTNATSVPVAAPPSSAVAPAEVPTTIAPSTAPPVAAAAAPSSKRASMSSSDLAEQNRLYADAMAAKRRGETTAAIGALDRLMGSYPQGPLAESAAVERMRILAASDRSRAAEAARAYLTRHPNGYARAEAAKLAGSP